MASEKRTAKWKASVTVDLGVDTEVALRAGLGRTSRELEPRSRAAWYGRACKIRGRIDVDENQASKNRPTGAQGAGEHRVTRNIIALVLAYRCWREKENRVGWGRSSNGAGAPYIKKRTSSPRIVRERTWVVTSSRLRLCGFFCLLKGKDGERAEGVKTPLNL